MVGRLYSQSNIAYECEPQNKKAVKVFEQGILIYENYMHKEEVGFPIHNPRKQLDSAYSFFRQAAELDPAFADPYYFMADIKLKEAEIISDDDYNGGYPDYMEAEKCLKDMEVKAKKVIELCPKMFNYNAYYWLGSYYYDNRKYENAQKYLNTYIQRPNGNEKKSALAKTMISTMQTGYFNLIANPVPFTPEIVKGISTEKDEYIAKLSPDNEYAFFTRKYYGKRSMSDLTDKWYEDFSISERVSIDSFTVGKALPSPFNTGSSAQGAIAISIDNRELFITVVEHINLYGQGFENGDIYYSALKNGQWTSLMSIGDSINQRDSWEGQPSISADGKNLYFVSAREESINHSMDIYKSVKHPNGRWGKPVNLGPVINSDGNEKTPFLHPDSETLYFSSNGQKGGMGGYDIYYSKMNIDSGNIIPRNIGYPINSEDDEVAFFVSTDGKLGYFTSNKLSKNKSWDLFSFPLYEAARPEKVAFVKGELSDNRGNIITDAKVEFQNLATGKVTEGLVDNETGKFVAVVKTEPHQEEVAMTVKKPGYVYNTQLISINEEDNIDESTGLPVNEEIKMEIKSIKAGERYVLKDINFATNKYDLTDVSKAIIDEFIDFLVDNPTIEVAVYGHTDNVGDAQENLLLSEYRAKEVYNYIVKKGIGYKRLTYRGYGELKPIESNDSEEGKSKNRRTEFEIISVGTP